MQSDTTKRLTVADIVKFVVFVAIGFFFVYWFLLKLPADQKSAIWQSFRGANYLWVAVVMAACLLSHFVRALRWRLLYEPLGRQPSLFSTFGAVLVAYLANLAFPRLGEVLRCAVLRTSDGIAVDKSLGTVVTERLTDVLLNALIILMGMLFVVSDIREWASNGLAEKSASLPALAIAAAVALALLVAMALLYRRYRDTLLRYKLFAKVDKLIMGVLDGVKSIMHLGRRSLVLYMVYSLTIYLLYIVAGYIIFRAFPETAHLGVSAAFLLYFMGSVGMMFSQGGLGLYPVLVQMALAVYAVPMVQGLATGWLLWGAQQAVVLAFGLLFMFYFAIAKNLKKDKSGIDNEAEREEKPENPR